MQLAENNVFSCISKEMHCSENFEIELASSEGLFYERPIIFKVR